MKSIILTAICVFTVSCSTMKKTLIYSSLAGGMTGATAGAVLSPNEESRGANAAVFGLIGAGVAALAGYALYQDDPRNYKLKNMLLDDKQKTNPSDLELELGKIKIDANLSKEAAYEVPLQKLPEALKGKVKKQFLIKYQSQERYLKKGNKTFYIPAFNIYEHAYGENLKGEEDEE